jgi:hypothetical protein
LINDFGIAVAKARSILGNGSKEKMLENTEANLYTSRWWERLATISIEHSQREQKNKKRWRSRLLQLIRSNAQRDYWGRVRLAPK